MLSGEHSDAAISIRQKSRPDQKIDAAVALAVVEDEQAKGLDGFLANPIFG
jgi:hypothetical protein